MPIRRRTFLSSTLAAGASLALPVRSESITSEVAAPSRGQAPPEGGPIRFAAIGLNHGHISGLTQTLIAQGAELAWVYGAEPDLVAAFRKRFPQAKAARTMQEVLDDASVAVVASAAIPNQRAAVALAAMRHGKDVLMDKPAVTTLEQLAEVKRVQAETRRIFAVLYGRLESRVAQRAGELVQAGAIGRVVQTVGFGPHRLNADSRPAWVFEREQYGGILCDLATHQCDQFLFSTGSTRAEVVAAQVGNVSHPQFPGLEDFGDAMVRGDGGTGYMRVDWLTPDGMASWGDTRLTIMGTDGYLELRSNVDLAGRPGGNHLFLVDHKETRHIDCSQVAVPFGSRFIDDIRQRTETAVPQAHVFLATELALRAQAQAEHVSFRPA